MKLNNWCKQQGVSYLTGYNWFKAGNIPNSRQMPSGTILIDNPPQATAIDNNKVHIYCRVSNNSRKPELEYQVNRCTQFCTARGYEIIKVHKEVASGMNDNRKELWRMLDSSPSTIIVEHKDRLTRFGFNYIEKLLNKLNCKVIVINKDQENETDLIKDLVSIITSFCCRLYGLRRGRNKTVKIKSLLNDKNI